MTTFLSIKQTITQGLTCNDESRKWEVLTYINYQLIIIYKVMKFAIKGISITDDIKKH